MTQQTKEAFLQAAIAEARKGLAEGGIPIGSVLVLDGQIVGRGHNRRVQKGSVILHAEMQLKYPGNAVIRVTIHSKRIRARIVNDFIVRPDSDFSSGPASGPILPRYRPEAMVGHRHGRPRSATDQPSIELARDVAD